PLIAVHFLTGTREERPNRLRRAVLHSVDLLRDSIFRMGALGLRHARLTVGLAFASFVLAILVIPRLGVQFFPSAVRSQFTIDIFLPEGRDIGTTERAAERVEKIVLAHHGVASTVTYVGQGGPRFYYNVNPEPPTPNYA